MYVNMLCRCVPLCMYVMYVKYVLFARKYACALCDVMCASHFVYVMYVRSVM